MPHPVHGRKNHPDTPEHLGGHAWKTHTDEGALRAVMQWADTGGHALKTMLDIGCSVGGQVQVAKTLGLQAVGVDGDPALEPDLSWDFTKGPLRPRSAWDLIWCCEFVEHVDERYMPNYLDIMERSKVIVLTHAPPGKKGHHHVNLKEADYWIGAMAAIGLAYMEAGTEFVRANSTMNKDFIRDYGMVFANYKVLRS